VAGAALVPFVVGAALLAGFLVPRDGGGAPAVVPNSVVKLDPTTGAVLDVVPVGRHPEALAVTADAVWTVNLVTPETGVVARIDPLRAQVVKRTRLEGVAPFSNGFGHGAVWVGVSDRSPL
jgi:hypothetical protein